MALGEAPQRRTVLYTSWTARQDAKDGGAPAYAFATTKGGGNRVFDAEGKYLLQAEAVHAPICLVGHVHVCTRQSA